MADNTTQGIRRCVQHVPAFIRRLTTTKRSGHRTGTHAWNVAMEQGKVLDGRGQVLWDHFHQTKTLWDFNLTSVTFGDGGILGQG